jgi:acyl-[acyl-carrier-protein]-phospholipid O-acyltransferase/long-chain-fatty-acid--[acyl-carrier-protein] ligase
MENHVSKSPRLTKYGVPFPARDQMVTLKQLSPLPGGWTSLAAAFVKQARRSPDKLFATDTQRGRITFAEALLRSCVMARFLAGKTKGHQAIGVLVPPSVPATIANFASALLGKWTVNLNYAATADIINNAAKQCDIKVIITSKKVVEKLEAPLQAEVVYLEDLLAAITKADKAWGYVVAKVLPYHLMRLALPGLRSKPEDIATVMFTSGSTGDPKGVLLTNGNVLSNIHQINSHAKLEETDSVVGILPFFHSFGFTVTLWTMATLGRGAAYHISPLNPREVAKLVESQQPTLMACTPTLMRSYLARCTKEQFASVRWLLLGSEKLDPALAGEIQEKLGVEPVEGFGCTELAPVVAANSPEEVTTPDGRRVHGNKLGSVGQPVAGTAVAIVDIDTGEVLPFGCGKEGLIFVAGPQVMKGYLNRQAETEEVLDGDIYCTGDVGYVDADGFLFIVDRLDEFSKIGGEMVPNKKVAAKLREIGGVNETELVVTSIKDPVRGERLIVLYTRLEMTPQELVGTLASDPKFPKLWVPKAGDCYKVAAFPVKDTGKLDLKGIRAIARELASA